MTLLAILMGLCFVNDAYPVLVQELELDLHVRPKLLELLLLALKGRLEKNTTSFPRTIHRLF